MPATTDLTFLKLGGELLEPGSGLEAVLASIAALAGRGPLAIVHGGGREIDAETARRGVPKQAIEGLRITDAATLEAVVAVLAGTVNTRLVSGLVSRGVRAVGLTGADAFVGLSTMAPPQTMRQGCVRAAFSSRATCSWRGMPMPRTMRAGRCSVASSR